MLPQVIAQSNLPNPEPIRTYFNPTFSWWKEERYGRSPKTLILICLTLHVLLPNQSLSLEVWTKFSKQELSNKSQDPRQDMIDFSYNQNKNKKIR